MRLKYRLSLFFLVVVAVGAATTLLLVRRSTESMFRSFVFTGDSEKAGAYSSTLRSFYTEAGGWSGVQEMLHALATDRVVVADSRGVIVADTADELLGTVHPAMHLAKGIPIEAARDKVGTVLVGSMIDSSLTGIEERFLDSITASLVWATLASAGIALLLGLLLAARITRPLGELAHAAKSVASGDPSARVAVRGHDELAELAVSFNEMTAELKRLDAAKRQVIADSAHELRTPVTLIQGTIEGMIDGIFPLDRTTLESVHEETVRLSRLIDTLRELETIESGELELATEGVDLRETARKAVSLFASAAMAKSISLALEDSGGPVPVAKGDGLRIGEVIYNLISNAIKYTPEGGVIRVREKEGSGSLLRFSVDDSGPGIAIEERERVFERFYRIDKSRSADSGGRGLGLAIAAEIAKAHGGDIAIADSDLGGASFVVSLPRLVL